MAQLYYNKNYWLPIINNTRIEDLIENRLEVKIHKDLFNNSNYDDKWTFLQMKYKELYPEYCNKLILKEKISYYITHNRPTKALKLFSEFINLYPSADTTVKYLSDFSSLVLTFSENKTLLSLALDRIKMCVEKRPLNAIYRNCYANLLYKIDKKEQAIIEQQKTVDLANNRNKEYYQDLLNKMKKGELTFKFQYKNYVMESR